MAISSLSNAWAFMGMAQRSSPKGPHSLFFELNDLFFIVYAVPSATLIITGLVYNLAFGLGAGFGIALYGITYFLVHDVFIHKRIRIKLPLMGWYLQPFTGPI